MFGCAGSSHVDSLIQGENLQEDDVVAGKTQGVGRMAAAKGRDQSEQSEGFWGVMI